MPNEKNASILAQFVTIRNLDTSESLLDNPPYHTLASLTESDREMLFDLARSAFSAAFDPARMIQLLKPLINSDRGVPKAVLTARKQGLLVSSLDTLFSQNHRPSNKFRKMLTQIGKVSDPSTPEQRGIRVQKAIDYLATFKSEAATDYQPISDTDYQNFLRLHCLSILDIFSQNQLPIEKFHSGRKKIRDMMHVMQTLMVMNPSGELQNLYSQWFNVSKDLGNIHDQAIADAIVNNQPYQDQTAEVDNDFLQLISKLVTLEMPPHQNG